LFFGMLFPPWRRALFCILVNNPANLSDIVRIKLTNARSLLGVLTPAV
jgi:hypothetical protein